MYSFMMFLLPDPSHCLVFVTSIIFSLDVASLGNDCVLSLESLGNMSCGAWHSIP